MPIEGGLDELERQRRIARACLASEDEAQATGRLGLYRALVQQNLCAVARRLLPRTSALLEESAGATFERWFSRFLAERAPRTPYLRDVPVEFVEWAAPLWGQDPQLPDWLADVAAHEVHRFGVETAPRAPRPPLTDIALERTLVFVTPHLLGRYAFDVTEVSSVPPRRATLVLMFRDEDNDSHVLKVDAVREPVLGALLRGTTLGEALRATGGTTLGVNELASWLAALAEAGVLLGAAG